MHGRGATACAVRGYAPPSRLFSRLGRAAALPTMVRSRRSACAIRHGSHHTPAALKGLRMQRLTDALDFQTQALVLRAERQRLIASNIANADTPGYVARDMDFARALREATGQTSAVAAQA